MKNVISLFKKEKNDLSSKTLRIYCLGDSITEGVGSNTDIEDELNIKGSFMPYHKWWEKEYDAVVSNFGQSGSFVAKYKINKCPHPNNSIPFVLRYVNMSEDADLITIMGGVNDCQMGYYTPEEFGCPEDIKNKDIHTFCGALRNILEGLNKKFPRAHIVYLSPLKYGDVSDGLGANWNNVADLPHYIDAMKIICKEFNVHFIDLYTPKELHFCCDNVDDELMYGDRLHFGWKAHKILSQYIIERMESMGIIQIIS